ncbi:MAG: hypothetical protein CMB99_10565 [Flavobacteriaceae bacterium]|nr:hypothetical protein [Flavobacteriaceae bacterium]
MIKTEGYFTTAPLFYEVRKGVLPRYLAIGLFFDNEGKYWENYVWSKNDKKIKFQKEDFFNSERKSNYQIDGNEIQVTKNLGSPIEGMIYFEIINETQIRSKQDGTLLTFNSW